MDRAAFHVPCTLFDSIIIKNASPRGEAFFMIMESNRVHGT